ncbi:MAG TPA: PEP-CTERM sorting domain-containing protein [Lacipirellulaceae bacterium]|nr:PEP-CTERM sorting domain-containing protein [Lacipirellulaceae bacterium]
MRKCLFIMAAMAGASLLTGRALASYLALDDFDYTPVGSPLSGHGTWGLITTSGSPDPTIASGSLSHPDRLANAGNSAQLSGTGDAGNSKLPFSTTITSGTVYYSMLVQVNDISNLTNTTSGSYFAGFQPHTLISPAVTSVATGGGNLLIHRDADNASAYNLGVAASAGNAGNGDRVFDTTEFQQGDTVFVVVGYEMNPGTNDDRAFLWLNPDPSTYGAAIAPAPNVTSNGSDTVANDHGPVASFYLRNNSVEPDHTLVDDLRVATTWQEATSLTVVPEPSAAALVSLALLGFVSRRRR